MAHRWATEHFAVGHRAFCSGPQSILIKVVFECFWKSPGFGRKNHLNFGEDLFFGDHLFSAEKTVSIYFKTDLARKYKQYFESGAMENFQNQNGLRLEKSWEPLP